MKQKTQSTAIIAKCCDGAFRKIMLVEEHGDGVNAMAKYGQSTVYGTITYGRYTDSKAAHFARAE